MKKILFVMPSLNMGGVCSSFLNLLYELEDSNLNISVLCFDQDNIEKLPSYVKIIPTNKFLRLSAVKQSVINKESKLMGIVRLTVGFLAKKVSQNIAYRLLFFIYKKLKDYDVAISFTQTPNKSLFGGCNEFVLSKVEAKKKIAFLHCDYEKTGINTAYSKKIYRQFDKIAAVSDGVKAIFEKSTEDLKDKVFTVYNCHRFDNIKKLSKKGKVEYKDNLINFVTIARLSEEKGHERMLRVFAKLKELNYSFCWHVVGGGNNEFVDMFLNEVERYGISGSVKFYGYHSNPYPFIAKADMLLVPSFHEAAPMVYGEALSLCVPVLTTNTLSAYEFIEKNKFGIVCENTETALYESIKEILDNSDSIIEYKKNISNRFEATNEIAIKQFFDII